MLNDEVQECTVSGQTPMFSKTNVEICYYKTIGIGMHLIGDVYAHRTIVPQKTIKGVNPGDYDKNEVNTKDMFASHTFGMLFDKHEIAGDGRLAYWAEHSSDCLVQNNYSNINSKKMICGNWVCFQKAVSLGVVEFRDIHCFTLDSDSRTKYEDNTDFCEERYKDAKDNCKIFFEELMDDDEYDGIFIMLPMYGNKLNNFKGYSENIEPFYDYCDWSEVSTSKGV